MTIQPPSQLNLPEIDPEDQGARYWYERYGDQRAETEQLKQRVKALEEQLETLSEKLKQVRRFPGKKLP
jgi:transposase